MSSALISLQQSCPWSHELWRTSNECDYHRLETLFFQPLHVVSSVWLFCMCVFALLLGENCNEQFFLQESDFNPLMALINSTLAYLSFSHTLYVFLFFVIVVHCLSLSTGLLSHFTPFLSVPSLLFSSLFYWEIFMTLTFSAVSWKLNTPCSLLILCKAIKSLY